MATVIKQALVMGNEAYARTPINMCVNDATDMSICLHSMGFQVQPIINGDLNSTQMIIRQFIQSIQPGSIVMLYFSGHGIQYNGINYLLPVDNDLVQLKNLNSTAINIQEVINSMYSRAPRVMIIILDACRAFEGGTTRDGSRLFNRTLTGLKDGLAPMQAPPATIIAYACAADEFSTTLSMNGRNSLYTCHLLRHICTPNTDIDLVLRNVAVDVQRDPSNDGYQTPFRYSSCNETICLVDYGGMNAPMLPTGWQPESFFQPYQNQYVKAPDVDHFYPYINSSQYHFIMPHNYRTGKKKSLLHTITNSMTYGFPYLEQFYPRWL